MMQLEKPEYWCAGRLRMRTPVGAFSTNRRAHPPHGGNYGMVELWKCNSKFISRLTGVVENCNNAPGKTSASWRIIRDQIIHDLKIME